jgi:hypothetical protein
LRGREASPPTVYVNYMFHKIGTVVLGLDFIISHPTILPSSPEKKELISALLPFICLFALCALAGTPSPTSSTYLSRPAQMKYVKIPPSSFMILLYPGSVAVLILNYAYPSVVLEYSERPTIGLLTWTFSFLSHSISFCVFINLFSIFGLVQPLCPMESKDPRFCINHCVGVGGTRMPIN